MKHWLSNSSLTTNLKIRFYDYDKMKSKGNYKRNFWCNNLKLKLDEITNDLKSGTQEQ